MSDLTSDFDGAWKETVEVFLPALLELILPAIAGEIDWSQGFQFLDSELRSLFPKEGARRQHVDKLIRVFLRDGRSQWTYVHLEIQSQTSSDIPDRMFQYFYRIYDQYGVPILSIAILADPDADHRPDQLDIQVAGSGCVFRYHACKLTDFTDEFLEVSTNPVAKVILAHRIAQRTAKDPAARMQQKVRWIQELFRQGFQREQILNLIRALEAMPPLPERLEVEFRNQVLHSDPDKTMPIITSFERLARKEALAEGLSQGLSKGRTEGILVTLKDAIRDLLDERFGLVPSDIGDRLEQETNTNVLKSWHRRLATIDSLESFRNQLEG